MEICLWEPIYLITEINIQVCLTPRMSFMDKEGFSLKTANITVGSGKMENTMEEDIIMIKTTINKLENGDMVH